MEQLAGLLKAARVIPGAFQGGVLGFLAYVYVVGWIAGLTYALVQI